MLVGSGQVIVLSVIKQRKVVDGSCRDDLSDFPVDDLAGDRLGDLLPDGDPFALLDEFGDIVFCGMVRNPAHGNPSSLCKGNVEQSGGFLCILEEHFVEVTEPEKKQDIVGKGAAHRLILRHHGGEFAFLAGHGWIVNRGLRRLNAKVIHRRNAEVRGRTVLGVLPISQKGFEVGFVIWGADC